MRAAAQVLGGTALISAGYYWAADQAWSASSVALAAGCTAAVLLVAMLSLPRRD